MAPDAATPPQRRALLQRLPAATWPILAAAGTVVAGAMVHLVDPHEPGNYPVCPWLALTGTWCPGCGSMRAAAALTHLDLAGAAQMNLLLVLAVPFAVAAWVLWLWRSLRPGGHFVGTLGIRPRWIWLLLALFAVFTVVRNTGLGLALAPGGVSAATFLG